MPLLKRNQSKEENLSNSNPQSPDIKEESNEIPKKVKKPKNLPSSPSVPKVPLQIRLKEGWKSFWDLFFGRTDKQKLRSKLTYVGRKYSLFFLTFIIYSGVLLYVMQNPTSTAWYDIALSTICFRNPYQFGFGLTLMFIELAFAFSNEKILKFIFEKKMYLKQIILIAGLLVGNFFIAGFFVNSSWDSTLFISLFTMLWMIFQTVRIYTGSRKFASGLEAKWVSSYGAFRYMIAIILPYIILGFLVVVAWFFRFGSVLIALDWFGPKFPDEAYAMYENQMRVIMPILYIELILVFVFIIMQGIFTQVKGSTKRAGVFDSLSYALITFMMFWYVIYNNALFMVTDQSTVNAINSLRGSVSTSSAFFIGEYAISVFFLFWILIDLKKEFETGLMFFNNDGLILLLLSTIMAQTTSRVGLLSQQSASLSIVAEILSYDRIIIPFLIITLLGLTIVLYYRNPQEGSMFLRELRVTDTREERTMDTILKYFKREYIRTGQKIPIEEHLPSIQKIIGIPPNMIMELIHQIDYLNVDVNILDELDDTGNKIKYFEFIPITEKYQRGSEAELKAIKYLRDEFLLNISKERAFQRKMIPQQMINVYWEDFNKILIRSYDLRGYEETQLNKYQIAHPLHFDPYIEINQNLKLAQKEAKKPKKVEEKVSKKEEEKESKKKEEKDSKSNKNTKAKPEEHNVPIQSPGIKSDLNISPSIVKPSDVAKTGVSIASSSSMKPTTVLKSNTNPTQPHVNESRPAKAELVSPTSDVKTVKITKTDPIIIPASNKSSQTPKTEPLKQEIKTKTPPSNKETQPPKVELAKSEIKTKTPSPTPKEDAKSKKDKKVPKK